MRKDLEMGQGRTELQLVVTVLPQHLSCTKTPEAFREQPQLQATRHHGVQPGFIHSHRQTLRRGTIFLMLPRNALPFLHSYWNPLHPSNTCSNSKSQKNFPRFPQLASLQFLEQQGIMHSISSGCVTDSTDWSLNHKHFSPGPGCWTSKVRTPEDLVSGGGLLSRFMRV